MKMPGIEEKVAFLSQPTAYPNHIQHVEARQTHMSWVFLTDTHAWKLKKPVRTDYLDFSTAEARRRNCDIEVRLNCRLARDVYYGVVPLTLGDDGELELSGEGKPVDWLICMRRLPADRMLDALIAHHAVTREDLSAIAATLVTFYEKARPAPLTAVAYCNQLREDLDRARLELTATGQGLNTDLVKSLVSAQLEFLRAHSSVFESRVRAGKIVEAHGDLRPEHICIEPQPVIIDCLEFNQDLRILDVASELMFLGLECERLDAADIGEFILREYCARSGDRPPAALLAFYKAYHASVRARIAIWHLKDDKIVNKDEWINKANRYLHIAGEARSHKR